MYQTDKRTVITLDAGGTNFVFGAIRGNQDVIKPIYLPSNSHDSRCRNWPCFLPCSLFRC